MARPAFAKRSSEVVAGFHTGDAACAAGVSPVGTPATTSISKKAGIMPAFAFFEEVEPD